MLLEVSKMGGNLKLLVGVLVGVVVALVLVEVFSGGGMTGGMGPMMGSDMMGGGMMGGGLLGMLLTPVSWVLVLALFAALIVWILVQNQRR